MLNLNQLKIRIVRYQSYSESKEIEAFRLNIFTYVYIVFVTTLSIIESHMEQGAKNRFRSYEIQLNYCSKLCNLEGLAHFSLFC